MIDLSWIVKDHGMAKAGNCPGSQSYSRVSVSLDIVSVPSVSVFFQRATVRASERVKFLATQEADGAARTERSALERLKLSFSLLKQYAGRLDLDKRRRREYRKDLSESRKIFRDVGR